MSINHDQLGKAANLQRAHTSLSNITNKSELKLALFTAISALMISCIGFFGFGVWILGQYRNKRRLNKRPLKILLIRHTESEGNVDSRTYTTTSDVMVKLTERGREQADETGKRLARIIGDKSVFVYISPYQRTKETAEIALSHLNPKQIVAIQEDVRLREQEFSGGFQEEEKVQSSKLERINYSKFFFRFQGGESSADVYDRVSMFNDSLWRDFSNSRMDNSIVLLFGHGIVNRLFLMRWLHWSYDLFERTSNPENGSILELVKIVSPSNPHGVYQLTEESLKMLNIHGIVPGLIRPHSVRKIFAS